MLYFLVYEIDDRGDDNHKVAYVTTSKPKATTYIANNHRGLSLGYFIRTMDCD